MARAVEDAPGFLVDLVAVHVLAARSVGTTSIRRRVDVIAALHAEIINFALPPDGRVPSLCHRIRQRRRTL